MSKHKAIERYQARGEKDFYRGLNESWLIEDLGKTACSKGAIVNPRSNATPLSGKDELIVKSLSEILILLLSIDDMVA